MRPESIEVDEAPSLIGSPAPMQPGPDSLDVSVVIPCLDEELTIGECVRRAWDAIEREGLRGEVIVVFRTGVSDAHCGLRVVRRSALRDLDLRTTGMEFATEMVVKAKLAGLRVNETPITYAPRPAGSESKLHSLTDGLRHLRFLL